MYASKGTHLDFFNWLKNCPFSLDAPAGSSSKAKSLAFSFGPAFFSSRSPAMKLKKVFNRPINH